jgi:hypothetical protein
MNIEPKDIRGLRISDGADLSALRDNEFPYFVDNLFCQAISGGQDSAAICGHPSGYFFEWDSGIERKTIRDRSS